MKRVLLASAVAVAVFSTLPAQANSIALQNCPRMSTSDIKSRAAAIKSCDSFYKDSNGNVKKFSRDVTIRYLPRPGTGKAKIRKAK